MAKRKGLSKGTRFEVFKRDAFTCQYCGRTPPAIVLEVDHIVPVADGGSDGQENLVTACFDCNRGKGAAPLTVAPESLGVQLARAMEAREQLDAYNRFLMSQREIEQQAVQEIVAYYCDQLFADSERTSLTLNSDCEKSITVFVKRLPEAVIYDAIDITHSRLGRGAEKYDQWKYFCGVCWRRIKEGGQQ